jgi:hypothetical protein
MNSIIAVLDEQPLNSPKVVTSEESAQSDESSSSGSDSGSSSESESDSGDSSSSEEVEEAQGDETTHEQQSTTGQFRLPGEPLPPLKPMIVYAELPINIQREIFTDGTLHLERHLLMATNSDYNFSI